MGNKPARNHHFLPQFYLAGFTNQGSKNNQLWALDHQTGRQWEAKPRNVAFKKDFYNIDLPDNETDDFEKALAEIENLAAPVIKRVLETKQIPADQDYEIFICFVALLACRVPARREVFDGMMKEVVSIWSQLLFQTPERYEAYIKEVQENTKGEKRVTSYEDMKAFVDDESRYKINFSNNTYLQNMITQLDVLIPLLLKRNWTLLFTDTNSYFVCSDSPLNLHWTPEGKGIWGPGFGVSNTEVTLPLSKDIMLLGRFEEVMPAQYISREDTALMNSFTIDDSEKYVYSKDNNFIWRNPSGLIADKKDLIEFFRLLKQEEEREKS
ncbi:hypothetical protein B9G55_13210 [Saccharibacillus sp. O16]|nr:hypothetical protein B9G55_13210 [Saccharibacillus sp. O16]